MALLQTVTRAQINPNRGLKHRVNQIVGILSGGANGTVTPPDGATTVGATQQDVRDAVAAMLDQLPTTNPGAGGGYWRNAGVVTKGS